MREQLSQQSYDADELRQLFGSTMPQLISRLDEHDLLSFPQLQLALVPGPASAETINREPDSFRVIQSLPRRASGFVFRRPVADSLPSKDAPAAFLESFEPARSNAKLTMHGLNLSFPPRYRRR